MTKPSAIGHDLEGSAVIITGSTRGIGFAIARHFLAHGANIVLSGLDAAETLAAAERLGSEWGSERIASHVGDVAQLTTAESLVGAAFEHFDRLDALVCNAGIGITRSALDHTADDLDRTISVNLKGSFLVAQQAAKVWIDRKQRDVSICFTSSIAGRAGVANLASYGASKGAVDQMVRNLAVEWAPHGIRVNAVAPGFVDNLMGGGTPNPETEARVKNFTPLGRRASVDEVAAPFVFLASRAASYITGSILMVDGGYTAQ